jgi:hypothetical protein
MDEQSERNASPLANVIICQLLCAGGRARALSRFSRLQRRLCKPVGEWLSLVEHLVRDQGVGGSNPLSPTNLFRDISSTSGFPSTALWTIL